MTEKELIEELIKLQISQTATLNRLLESSIARTQIVEGEVEVETKVKKTQEDSSNRPFEVGDSVVVLTPGISRLRKNTVCIVTKIGISRITVETPNGNKIVRAQKNLRRVTAS